jgi:hypothetical protein
VLGRGQRLRLFPRAPFSACRALPPLCSGQVSLDEAEHFTAQSSCQRRCAPMVFGIIPECRSASFRNQRSASPESPLGAAELRLDRLHQEHLLSFRWHPILRCGRKLSRSSFMRSSASKIITSNCGILRSVIRLITAGSSRFCGNLSFDAKCFRHRWQMHYSVMSTEHSPAVLCFWVRSKSH